MGDVQQACAASAGDELITQRVSLWHCPFLRLIVSNLLRADKATKLGIKNKQPKAGFDEHYRARVLGMNVS